MKYQVYNKDNRPTVFNRDPEPIFFTTSTDLLNAFIKGYNEQLNKKNGTEKVDYTYCTSHFNDNEIIDTRGD